MDATVEDKLLRVNMSAQTVSDEPFPTTWRMLGGRALCAKIMISEVDPKADPLSAEAKLVLAPGFLSGTMAPTSGRLSVGGKSPLTGRIKEANSGGQAGQHLMRLGYRAVILEGKPADPEKRWLLEIDQEGARLKDAADLKGQRNYAASEMLWSRYDKRASFVLAGPAAELGLKNSSVALTDMDHRYPTRHAARGGMGAVMASKGLKAIAIDPGKAHFRKPAREPEFKTLFQTFSKEYRGGGAGGEHDVHPAHPQPA
jgi:aldehyde:ferredoxin oxidoreductase